MKRLATMWTEHLQTGEEKVNFEKLLRNSTLSLGRTYDIVEGLMNSTIVSERSNKVYDSPNWTYLQAHTNGMLQAYGNILRLLAFAKDPKPKGK